MLLTNTLFRNGCRLFNNQFRVFCCTKRNQLLNKCLIKENNLFKTKQQMTRLLIDRSYSNQTEQDQQQDKNQQQQQQREQTPIRLQPLVNDEIHLMPNFFVALKSSYYLHAVLRAQLDKDFSMVDFVDASKQATEVVSDYLSKENYEALEGLLSNKAIKNLRDKITSLSTEQKNLIPIDKRDIYGYFPYRIEVVYEGEGDNQRTFAEITEVFYSLRGLYELHQQGVMPPLTMGLMPEYQEKIYVCNLKFRRDYTDGTDAPWIIDMYNQFALIAMDT